MACRPTLPSWRLSAKPEAVLIRMPSQKWLILSAVVDTRYDKTRDVCYTEIN